MSSTTPSKADSSFSMTSNRFRESTHLIPSPSGYKQAHRFNTITLALPVIIITPVVTALTGIALEAAIAISNKDNGFAVPQQNVLSLLSVQFLLAFVPTLFVVPLGLLWRDLDFHVRWYQPYVTLLKGNASAEESLLLDYLYLGPVFGGIHALRWKHRLVFWSAFAAVSTYAFQPLAGGIFAIQQAAQEDPVDITSILTIGLNPGLTDLTGFVASAGFAQAAVYNNLSDPPFIKDGWATAPFEIPQYSGYNGSLVVNTIAVQTTANCSNPIATPNITQDSNDIIIIATSIDGCTQSVVLDPTAATQQYGVLATSQCNTTSSTGLPVEQQPVMFWFFHNRTDNNQFEARTVFCAPFLNTFDVFASADLTDNSINTCNSTGNFGTPNNVTGPPLNGNPFNAVVFSNSTNPFIQARGVATNNGIPGAIFRSANQLPGGPQPTFDSPNGFLDLTTTVYTQHLALSAKAVYFVPDNTTLHAQLTHYVPRLVINPLPAHLLSIALILVGIIGLGVMIVNHRQRRKLLLASPPGTIASIVSLTSRSGFGELLLPYDNEDALARKLRGLRFRLDERTGAILAENDRYMEPEGQPEDDTLVGSDDATVSLLTEQFPNGTSSHRTSPLSREYTTLNMGYPPIREEPEEPYRTPYDP